jgi:hypothetical protein
MSAKLFLMMKAVSETIGRRLNCLQFHNFSRKRNQKGYWQKQIQHQYYGKVGNRIIAAKIGGVDWNSTLI